MNITKWDFAAIADKPLIGANEGSRNMAGEEHKEASVCDECDYENTSNEICKECAYGAKDKYKVKAVE